MNLSRNYAEDSGIWMCVSGMRTSVLLWTLNHATLHLCKGYPTEFPYCSADTSVTCCSTSDGERKSCHCRVCSLQYQDRKGAV